MPNTSELRAPLDPEKLARDPMTLRRELLDVHVVRQPTRADARPDTSGRLASAERPTSPEQIESSSSDASGTTGSPEVILVKVGFKQVATRVREIMYVESARNYVRIHLDNGVVLKSRVPIDRLASHLGHDRFLRIHRGRLVNMERIRAVTSLAGGRLQLTLSPSSTIVVARDRRRAVLAQIGAVVERRPHTPPPPRTIPPRFPTR